MTQSRLDEPLTLKLGREELVIRQRYEVLSILNDFLIAIWFLVGSILFLFPEYEKLAIWLFIVGSFQFLVRPTLRLASHLHLQRLPESQWEK
tara:strand:- start:226 stop:501 length:276 start_codon:yes stop_codon:yes gene_type:complete